MKNWDYQAWPILW